jgi:hypothetical protein
MALAAMPSAGALAAGEESGSTTEPSGSSGWTPVEGDSGASAEAAPPVQQGSSLGSGGGAAPPPSHQSAPESTGSQPAAPAPVEPVVEEPSYGTGSGGHSEYRAPTPEAASPPPARKTAVSKPPAPAHPAAKVGIGSAIAVAFPASPRGGAADSAATPPAASSAASASHASSESSGLPVAALIAIGLILVLAGLGLILFLRRRQIRRRREGERLKREHAREAAMRRAELEQAIEAAGPQRQPFTLNRNPS